MEEEALVLTPSMVWEQSPLNREQIDTILIAAGEKISAEIQNPEALRLCLTKVAARCEEYCGFHWASVEQLRAIADAFQSLTEAINAAKGTAPQIPMPLPQAWFGRMRQWIREVDPQTPRKHQPNFFNKNTYPILLSFFALAYGKSPGQTDTGPIVRFLEAFYAGMSNLRPDLDGASFPSIALYRSKFKPLTKSQYKTRITTFLPMAAIENSPRNWYELFSVALDGQSPGMHDLAQA